MRITESQLAQIIRGILLSEGPSRYWGVGGSGIIFVCSEDSTVFLQKRSAGVSGGAGQWAFPGGGIQPAGQRGGMFSLPIPEELVLPDESPVFYQNALKEVKEECGSVPKHRVVDSYLYEDRGFKYKTFIADMDISVKDMWEATPDPDAAWESSESGWFSMDEFFSLDLFFGFTDELVQKTVNAVS